MVKDIDPREYLSHVKFILEKAHSRIKEVHVTNDIYRSLEGYVKKTTRNDCKIISDKSLILRGKTIKNAIPGSMKIAFIEKDKQSF